MSELMRLNNLKPADGAKRPAKRVGRGIGSGTGKTCGRGHKGQNLDLAAVFVRVLRVAKCLCRNVCLSMVLLHALVA